MKRYALTWMLLGLFPFLMASSCETSPKLTDVPPAVPNNLQAAAGNAKVSLSWDTNTETGLKTYVVYQGTSSDDLTEQSAVNAPATTTTITGLENDTTYFFAIAAEDETGQRSSLSTAVSATPTAEIPAAPNNLQAVAGNAEVTLSWDTNTETDLKSYVVYQGTSSDDLTEQSAVNAPATTTTITSLENDTTYYFAVAAEDEAGHRSSLSTAVSAMPTAEALTVTISSPNADLYTNSNVTIQLVISGGVPNEVVLLANDTTLVSLTAPYTYVWDTSSVSEGSYALKAEAKLTGATFASPLRTVTVDRTAPEIISRTPNPNNLNVAVTTPIAVTFSEAVKASTVTDSHVVLAVSSVVTNKTLSLNQAGDTLAIEPSSSLDVPNSLEVSLSTAITDRAGNALSLPADAWTWTTPFWLQLGGALDIDVSQTASSVTIQSDAADNVVATWSEGFGDLSNYNVYVKHWDGSSWTSLGGALDANGSSGALVYDLVLDKEGNPFVFWNELVSPSGLYVWHWNGKTWDQLGDKLNSEGVNAGTIDLNPEGNPVIAWSERHAESDSFRVYVKAWTGKGWEQVGRSVLNVDDNDTAIAPRIVLDGSGIPTVAWSERKAGSIVNPYNGYVKRWDGVNWQQIGGAVDISEPRSVFISGIDLDSLGNPVVSFSEEIGDDNNTVYVKYWTGLTWSVLFLADINSSADASSGDVLLDASDIPWLVLTEEVSPSNRDVYLRYRENNVMKSFGSALDGAESRDSFARSMSFNQAGEPMVAFSEKVDTNNFNVYVKRYNAP